jgi:hypothetical protein
MAKMLPKFIPQFKLIDVEKEYMFHHYQFAKIRNESKKVVTELANKPYPFKAENDIDYYIADFITDAGIKYEVIIEANGENSVEVSFYSFNNKTNYSISSITNTGDAFRVLATVMLVVKTYLNKYKKITTFEFNADKSEPSRVKLYNAFVKILPKFIPTFKIKETEDIGDAVIYTFKKIKKPTTIKEYIQAADKTFVWETRNAIFAYIKQYLKTWPDYVIRDWIYRQFGKGVPTDELGNESWKIKELIDQTLKAVNLTPTTKWTFNKQQKFTMDMWDDWTLDKIQKRWGGKSHPDIGVTNDAERHATQSKLAAQQGGVRSEPVILIQHGNKFELVEGWHRTIQHFKQFPNGYVGPAWIAQGSVTESKEELTEMQKACILGGQEYTGEIN